MLITDHYGVSVTAGYRAMGTGIGVRERDPREQDSLPLHIVSSRSSPFCSRNLPHRSRSTQRSPRVTLLPACFSRIDTPFPFSLLSMPLYFI